MEPLDFQCSRLLFGINNLYIELWEVGQGPTQESPESKAGAGSQKSLFSPFSFQKLFLIDLHYVCLFFFFLSLFSIVHTLLLLNVKIFFHHIWEKYFGW